MLQWFQALMPKEERFFELLVAHSHTVVGGAEALRAMLEGGEAVTRHYQAVMDWEHKADLVTRDILMAVRRTFITPFDRGDIKDLITSMDNAIDQMQKTAKAIELFDVRSFEPDMRGIADAIVQCAALVQEAVPLLGSISNQAARLSGLCERITQIEGQADEMHDSGLKKLYQACATSGPNPNPMAFFAGSEIYDHLEKVVDRFDDVANEIQGIVIEHV